MTCTFPWLPTLSPAEVAAWRELAVLAQRWRWRNMIDRAHRALVERSELPL